MSETCDDVETRARCGRVPSAVAVIAQRRRARAAAAAARSSPRKSPWSISGDRGHAAALRGARFRRADARRGRDRQDARPGAVGRPRLRARVLPDPARHLRNDPGRAHARTGAVRAWRELGADARRLRHRAADGQRRHACRCGCSTCARGSRSSRRNTPARATNPRLYAHTISDEIHQQQRALRASRARSWRSRPIATASGWSAPSRTAR